MRGIATIAVVAVLVGTGCGSDDPERSTVATRLAALCEQARLDVEALGLPAEQGFSVVEPTANIALRLAADVARLDDAAKAERDQLALFASYLARYGRGLLIGVQAYEATKSADAYAAAVGSVTSLLVSAERLATRMGAPECAERPFADVEAP